MSPPCARRDEPPKQENAPFEPENRDTLANAGVYDRVYALIGQIPAGHVTTYGHIARLEGHCTARMVGYALATTPDGIDIPWQRVLNGAGKVSERRGGGGTAGQKAMLQAEGVLFNASNRLDLSRYGWAGPDPDWIERHAFNPAPPPVALREW